MNVTIQFPNFFLHHYQSIHQVLPGGVHSASASIKHISTNLYSAKLTLLYYSYIHLLYIDFYCFMHALS